MDLKGIYLALGLTLIPWLSVAGESQWIHGAWVSLHAGPETAAEVRAQWPTNTPVRLLRRQDTWCEVEGPSAQRGFVPCDQLGDRPLAFADLKLPNPSGTNPATGHHSLEIPLQEFWISPSWDRFQAAGLAMNDLLSPEQQARELEERKPIRWKLPEFEAMKARMREGISVSSKEVIQLKVHPVRPEVANAYLPDGLPKIRSSLLQRRDELLIDGPIQQPTLDQMTALSGGRLRLTNLLRGPEYFDGKHGGQYITGFWDIAEAEIAWESPPIRHTLDTDGLLAASHIPGALVGDYFDDPDMGCGVRPHLWTAKDETPLADTPTLPTEAGILSFFVAKPLAARQALVETRVLRAKATDAEGKQTMVKVILQDIDLDRDGVPDIALWTGQTPGGISPFLTWKKVFLNIQGVWTLDQEWTEDDCT
ncbi:MAG: hypothetical protein A2286_12070 [Gammaproteobacteria bacterium RIFOXYA12_FULL_61_12]|nr:MAG: hypothetical protein A2286_12070 [Gammaproteobacteria bacterium RIFOXYA12_FULL_61_12]OGT89129.1 MAG: hypothetical protein A2514_09780 [Gammaproteobacteria bacterium RIFOXYD12_FULL_61_37]